MAVPKLTTVQRKAALGKAAAARQYRADIKKKLKSAALNLDDVLAQSKTNEQLSRLRVIDLLRAMPGVGEVKAHDMMDRLGVAPNRRLRGLGAHQIAGLQEEFKKRG